MTLLRCTARRLCLPSTCILLLLLLVRPGSAEGRVLREEPFDSFRKIDSELSILQKQFTEVRRGVEMGGPAETKEWVNLIHTTEQTTSSIEAIARKLALHY